VRLRQAAQGKRSVEHEGDLAASTRREHQHPGPEDSGVLAERRKYSSSRPFTICRTKSIVETGREPVIAELIDDIAAERIATIRHPFSRCGTSVSMKSEK